MVLIRTSAALDCIGSRGNLGNARAALSAAMETCGLNPALSARAATGSAQQCLVGFVSGAVIIFAQKINPSEERTAAAKPCSKNHLWLGPSYLRVDWSRALTTGFHGAVMWGRAS